MSRQKLQKCPSLLHLALLALVLPWASLASACDLEYCSVDLDFATRAYVGCAKLSECVGVSRPSGKWAAWRDGHFSYFGPDILAITDQGLLIEPESQNYLHFSRDLSNDAWMKTHITAALAATGADGVANSATTLTALEPDAIVSQAVQLVAGQRNLSLFLRRRTGSGPVDISYDGGRSWLRCEVSNVFRRCATGTDSLVNPKVAIRIEVKGDTVDVDYCQLEGQRWPTSPIPTADDAPIRRAADNVTLLGAAAAPLQSGEFSLLVEGSGAPPRERAIDSVEIIGGPNASLFITPHVAGYMRAQNPTTGASALAQLGWNGSPLLASGSMAKPFRFAASSDAKSGAAICADAGEVAHLAAFGRTDGPWRLGGGGSYGGLVRRLTIWDKRLDDARLRAVSYIDIRPARVSDIDKQWKNYAVRDILTVNGAKYETQAGIHYDRFTGAYPLQTSANGVYLKFNLFPGNTWAIDSQEPFRGSERVELSGNLSGSLARFPGPTSRSIWVSDAVYVEKGDPITTDWLMIGQIHDRVGIGPVFSMNIHTGDYLSFDILTKDFARSLGEIPFARGRWYRRVMNLKFDPSGNGFIKVWIDGKQIVDYHGVTGNPDTKYYYWKFGLYRSHAPEYVAARYANVRVGGEELATKIEAPDSIPTGFCSDDGSCYAESH